MYVDMILLDPFQIKFKRGISWILRVVLFFCQSNLIYNNNLSKILQYN